MAPKVSTPGQPTQYTGIGVALGAGVGVAIGAAMDARQADPPE
jgi:hypothetical protein